MNPKTQTIGSNQSRFDLIAEGDGIWQIRGHIREYDHPYGPIVLCQPQVTREQIHAYPASRNLLTALLIHTYFESDAYRRNLGPVTWVELFEGRYESVFYRRLRSNCVIVTDYLPVAPPHSDLKAFERFLNSL